MESYEKYEDDLRAEYYHTFKEVEVYFKTSELSDKEMEDVMSDILDLFLMAQSEGKPLKEVIGEDTESFCKNYRKGMWKFPRIKTVLRYSGGWLGVILICIACSPLIDYFEGRIQDLWMDKADITRMITFFIPICVGELIDKYIIKRKVFKNCINRENHIERKGWIAVGILAFLLSWLCEELYIKIYASLAQTVFMAVIVLIIYVVIRLVYEVSSGYQIKKRRH